jgi:hypothetical protein
MLWFHGWVDARYTVVTALHASHVTARRDTAISRGPFGSKAKSYQIRQVHTKSFLSWTTTTVP